MVPLSLSEHLLQQAQKLAATHKELSTGWKSRRFDRHGARNAKALEQVRTRMLLLRGHILTEMNQSRHDDEALKTLTEALKVLGEISNV